MYMTKEIKGDKNVRMKQSGIKLIERFSEYQNIFSKIRKEIMKPNI